jgi:hypothetical protein
MSRKMTGCLGLALIWLGLASGVAVGQVVEREQDVRVTGPKGRTTERDIRVVRGPGFVDRQVEIKRPGETIIRDTRIQGYPGGRPYAGPRAYGGPRFVENVIVQRPPVVSAFVGLPALSFFFGGAAPPPPPVVVAPAPVVVPPQPPPVFDPFADALGRLKSFHASSRRDGALTLGRIGDPRAVPALNERLEHDFDKEVRVAAAYALGEIADERGAVALEKASLYDKRHEVRDAAKLALQKLPRPGEVPNPTVSPAPTRRATPSPARPPAAEVDPGPSPSPTLEPPLEDRPPPPPIPAEARPLPPSTGRDPS